MKKTMRSLLCLALCLVMCLGMTACVDTGNQTPTKPIGPGSNTDPAGVTDPPKDLLDNVEGLPASLDNADISIVYWYNPDQYKYDTSKNKNVYDPILEAIPYFEEKYGGKVNVIYSDWGSMLDTVTALQQSNDAPDLFEVYDETMHNVILSGVAQSLDGCTSDLDYSYYDVDKELFSWKGSTYAIPLKPYAFYIMFNRDLFDMEGMDAPDTMFRNGEWNWDNFRKVCKALTKFDEGGEATQLAYGSWEDTILSFMYANGGSLLNVDTATGTVTPNLEDVKVQNTLSYLVELRDSFVYGNDMFGWFDNGTLAMIRGKEFPVDLPFEVGMVPFPTGDDYDGKNLVVYPQGMAVPTGAKNPEGAVAFMRIVNELQKAVGDQKEANRIGQENYDMIYAEDVKMVYAYDKGLNDIGTHVATFVNYIRDGVPAATITANMLPLILADIGLVYGG